MMDRLCWWRWVGIWRVGRQKLRRGDIGLMCIQIKFVVLRGVMMDWHLRRERMITRFVLLRFQSEERWVYNLRGKRSLSGFMMLLSKLWLLNLAKEVFSPQVPPSHTHKISSMF